MADRKTRKIVVPPQGGVVRNFANRLKLIFKLMGDPRVSPWVKLIPIGAFVYLVSPIDLIMGIPGVDALDDAAVIWMGIRDRFAGRVFHGVRIILVRAPRPGGKISALNTAAADSAIGHQWRLR